MCVGAQGTSPTVALPWPDPAGASEIELWLDARPRGSRRSVLATSATSSDQRGTWRRLREQCRTYGVVLPGDQPDGAVIVLRSASGASFLVAGGVTVAFAHGCAESIDSCTELYGLVLPQIRVGYGRWF